MSSDGCLDPTLRRVSLLCRRAHVNAATVRCAESAGCSWRQAPYAAGHLWPGSGAGGGHVPVLERVLVSGRPTRRRTWATDGARERVFAALMADADAVLGRLGGLHHRAPYSSRAVRKHLRKRGIRAVLPVPAGQRGHRLRRGRRGGRPPTVDVRHTNSTTRSSGASIAGSDGGVVTRYEKTAVMYLTGSDRDECRDGGRVRVPCQRTTSKTFNCNPLEYASCSTSFSFCASLSVALKSRLPAPSSSGKTSRW